MAGDLDALPGGQPSVNILTQMFKLFFQALDLAGQIDPLVRRELFELIDLALELDYRFFEF